MNKLIHKSNKMKMQGSKYKNKSFNQKNIKRISFSILLLFAAMLLQTSIAHAKPISELDEQLEQAILAENWEKVVSMLSDANEPNLPAVFRLVKGHACLATNRNNESLCLFLNATSQEGLLEWQRWSQDFATTHPESPIAYYFKGDSYARLEQWNQAIADFNTALEIDPNHPLALNARGIAHAGKQQFDSALCDLLNALHTNPRFADAYANLGFLAIQENEGPSGAIEDFNKALEISPDFAIAVYGRGCVKSVLGQWEDSRKDIENADEKTDCLSGLIRTNVAHVLDHIRGAGEITLAKGESPGMRVDTCLKEIERGSFGWGWNHGALDEVTTLGTQNPELQPVIREKFRDIAQNNPARGGQIYDQLQQMKNHKQWGLDLLGSSKLTIENDIRVGSKGVLGGVAVAGAGSAGVGGAIGGKWDVATGVRTEVEIPGKSFEGLLRPSRNFAADLQNDLGLQQTPAQGFKTSLEEATWDEGTWPFNPLYGLFYKIECREKSTSNTKETGK